MKNYFVHFLFSSSIIAIFACSRPNPEIPSPESKSRKLSKIWIMLIKHIQSSRFLGFDQNGDSEESLSSPWHIRENEEKQLNRSLFCFTYLMWYCSSAWTISLVNFDVTNFCWFNERHGSISLILASPSRARRPIKHEHGNNNSSAIASGSSPGLSLYDFHCLTRLLKSHACTKITYVYIHCMVNEPRSQR